MSLYIGKVNGEPIAFHKKKKVVIKYLSMYRKLHGGEIEVTKLDKLSKYEYKDIKTDYYLIEWENVYIQNKFFNVAEAFFRSTDELSELLESLSKYSKKDMSKKEKKLIKELEKVLQSKIPEAYIPSIQELREAEYDLERYQNGIY